MKRFYTLFFLLALGAVLHAQTPPNFVIIIADDLNDWVQGYNGHIQTKTPNIAKIEKKGTTFTNAYCNAPKCAPSRTSLITGKDCLYTNVYNNDDVGCKNFRKNFTEAKGNPTVFTIPEMLKDSAGYFTYTISKVMQCYAGLPDYDTTIADPCLKGLSWSKAISFGADGGAGEGGGDLADILDYGDANDDGVNGFRFTPIPDTMEDNMMDYIATDTAINFINDYASNPENYCNKPFFLTIGYKRPHGPIYIPEKYFLPYYNVDWEQNPYNKSYNDPVGTLPYNGVVMPPQPDPMWSDYDALPVGGVAHSLNEDDWVHDDFLEFGDYLLGDPFPPVIDAALSDSAKLFVVQESERANGVMAYLASIKFVDAQIGRLYNAIKLHPEIFNNTVFIITSDHGYSMGEKTHWRKGCLWETDIRIPLIIADMRTPIKKTTKRPVTLLDIMPTVLDLAGVTYPTFPDSSLYVDGFSLLPLLADPNATWDRPVLSSIELHGEGEGHCFPQYSVRDDEWHYIRYKTNGAPYPACNEAASEIQEELYHIGKNRNIDPNEWTNLADNPAYDYIKEDLVTYIPGGVNYLQFAKESNDVIVEEINYSFSEFPNPTSQIANFRISDMEAGNAEFSIADLTGRMLSTADLNINEEGFLQFSFSVEHLQQGYYIATVKQGGKVQHVNFIVAR